MLRNAVICLVSHGKAISALALGPIGHRRCDRHRLKNDTDLSFLYSCIEPSMSSKGFPNVKRSRTSTGRKPRPAVEVGMVATADDALALLRRHGVLTLSPEPGFASLIEAIVGGPIHGSWWGHEQGGLIFQIASAL